MAALHRPIWMRTLAPDRSLQTQEPPRLIGDAARLDRVMSALRQVRQQLAPLDLDLYLRHEHSGGCPNH